MRHTGHMPMPAIPGRRLESDSTLKVRRYGYRNDGFDDLTENEITQLPPLHHRASSAFSDRGSLLFEYNAHVVYT